MPTKEPPSPHSFDAGSMSLVPGLFEGLGVCSWIVGDIPAARYRERVIGESQEAAEAGDSKDPTNLIFYFFILEIWMNVRAHLLVPPHLRR